MLAPFALAVIGISILVTSFISGIFGMAGGLILLGVLLLFMDVAPAMVLFGTIQIAANGWRVALWLWRPTSAQHSVLLGQPSARVKRARVCGRG